ncbi:hypothetical protein KW801_00855 [Candidatus Saccharibacteria bacterium]|nr:hypothetical protein [Candidatus Saccharibacteria bacterium]
MLVHGTAHAATAVPIPSNTLPESSDFSQGNNVWMTVANNDGVNYLLDAQDSTVRIYSKDPSITLTVVNGGHCPGNGPDAGASEGEAQTRFDVWSLKPISLPNNNYVDAPYTRLSDRKTFYSNQAGCGGYTFTVTSEAGVGNFAPGFSQNGKYAFEFEARWLTNGAYGWNQFKLSVPAGDGRLSYYAGAGDHFALKSANSACSPYIYPGCTGDFKMGFAPTCNLDAGQSTNVTVRWFDADAGQPNQAYQTPVKTALLEYDASNNFDGYANIVSTNGATDAGAGQLYITSGNNVGGSATITIKGHHKYAWVWYGIHTANGIQFQLPVDSYSTLVDFAGGECNTGGGTPTVDASCTATPSNANPLVNQGINMKVKVTNTSSANGPDFDSTYEVRQVPYANPPAGYTSPSPGGGVRNLSGKLPPGSIDNNIPVFNINARASPQTIRFYYALFDSSGKAIGNNPLCFHDVTWRATTGGGSISADCSSTAVSVSGITATWHPPPNIHTGVATRISRVPVAVVVTEVGNPSNTYTYLVRDTSGNFGMNNDGSTQSLNTYDIWAGMWPHKSYTLDLYVEGVGGGDSTTYNNNGFWNPANDANQGGFYYGITKVDSYTTPTNCMDAYCGQPSASDAEPGQTKQFSYGIHVTNLTQRTYSSNDGNGYHFTVNTSGGFANVSGASASPDVLPGDPTDINVNFTARLDYNGQFSISMYFQGGLISLPGLANPCPPGEVTPASRSYFEVRAGDLSTGGGFGRASDSQCSTSAPGYISPATTGYDYAGGIRAYGIPNQSRGSEAEFGALSLGLTLGSLGGPIGFFSGHGELMSNSGAPNAPNGGNLGGYLNPGGTSAAHCVNDFFTKTRLPNTTPTGFSGGSVSGLNGQYEANGDITINASNIAPGQRLTLYVTGNVTIDGNINYAAQWDPTTRTNVPYFALIVKGNITLTSGVGRLEGLYVAQPNKPTNGIFSTCLDFCANQLIVNGAVIAQQVSLTRAHGTVGPLDADVNGLTQQPAEIFNYVPSMVIGLPFFNQNYNALESLFSLPPVF